MTSLNVVTPAITSPPARTGAALTSMIRCEPSARLISIVSPATDSPRSTARASGHSGGSQGDPSWKAAGASAPAKLATSKRSWKISAAWSFDITTPPSGPR